MTDVFNEVEEQLRSERYATLAKRGWPYALAVLVGALVVALAFWGFDSYSRAQDGKAALAYSHALESQAAGKKAEAETGYQGVAKSGPATYKALALMQLAGLSVGANKIPEAVAYLDRAQASAPDRITKDAAALKAGMLLVDTAPLAEVSRRLEPLTAAGRPYREMAREGLGVARLVAGRPAEARADFAILSFSPDVSDATRARARAALSVIDAGTAGSIPGAAKAAAVLPPSTPVQLPPGLDLPSGGAGAPQPAQ